MGLVSSGRTVRVLIYEVDPYIVAPDSLGEKTDGFYERIWQTVKADLMPRGSSYVFEETRVAASDHPNGTPNDGDYDVVVGLGHPAFDTANWAHTSPLFVRNYSVVYLPSRMSIRLLFYTIFLRKYVPIVILFVLISVVLGLVLYYFTPRTNLRNAIWQTVAGMMGELGYLTEKLSDRHKRVRWWGYVANLLILMCCLYAYIYLQATVNTTMIYAKDATEGKAGAGKALSPNMRLLVHPDLLRSSPPAVLANVDAHLVPLPFDAVPGSPLSTVKHTMHALDAYMAHMRTPPAEGQSRADGVLVDTVAYNYVRHETDYKKTTDAAARLGHHAVSIAVNPLRTDLLYDINASIHRLHSRREIRRICEQHTSTYSALPREHCIL